MRTPTVIDPKTTSHAEAYALWMNAPDPMATFFKTLDVTPLDRLSRRRGLKPGGALPRSFIF